MKIYLYSSQVDYVVHSWFLRTAWMSHMFRCYSPSWDQGEDMMLSICAWKYGRIRS